MEIISIESDELCPAQKHYKNHLKSVKKYQQSHPDKMKEKNKRHNDKIKMDIEKYQLLLEKKRQYYFNVRKPKFAQLKAEKEKLESIKDNSNIE